MPSSTTPVRWKKIPAGELKPGDRTEWGTGVNWWGWRTVSAVEVDQSSGIIRIWHKETDARFYDEYGTHHPVKVIDDSPAPPEPKPWNYPHKHNPKQHRDGREPWCNDCGLTADGRVPEDRFHRDIEIPRIAPPRLE